MNSGEYSGILTFAEVQEEIHPVSYEIIGKARELADQLDTDVYTVAFSDGSISPEELIFRGADKVFSFTDQEFTQPNELMYKINIVSLVEELKPEIFLIGATNFGRSLAPRIAAALDTGLTADCTDLKIGEDRKLEQIRPAFSGNVLAHIKTSSFPQMSTVRYREFDTPERDSSRKGEVISKEPSLLKGTDLRVLGIEKKEEVDLTKADIIVSGGRGLEKPGDFDLLEELADILGGKVGSSRPLVDDGWISKAHQVGYSGNRVKPKLYIACGISGASQHLVGMRDSEIIIAINEDPSAPIFRVADYGIVGDLYEILPPLIKKLGEEREQ